MSFTRQKYSKSNLTLMAGLAGIVFAFIGSTNTTLGNVLGAPGFFVGVLISGGDIHGSSRLLWSVNVANFLIYSVLSYFVFLMFKRRAGAPR